MNDRNPHGYQPRRFPWLAAGIGASVTAILVAFAFMLGVIGGGASAAEKASAVEAASRIARLTQPRATSSSGDICAAVATTARAQLGKLAKLGPSAKEGCAQLPPRVLKTAVGIPQAYGAATPTEAEIKDGSAVITDEKGRDVMTLTDSAEGWKFDTTAGAAQWRMNAAIACSNALSGARLNPIGAEGPAYREAIKSRRVALNQLAAAISPAGAPEQLASLMKMPNGALQDFRSGLNRSLAASSGTHFERDAPGADTLPTILQLVELLPPFREAGITCLGGPTLNQSAIKQGNKACTDVRRKVEDAFRIVGKAPKELEIASAYDELGGQWQLLAQKLAAVELGSAQSLSATKASAIAAVTKSSEQAYSVAKAIRANSGTQRIAQALSLSESIFVGSLLSLGFRECGVYGL